MSDRHLDLRDLNDLQHAPREVTFLFESPQQQARTVRRERRRKRVETALLSAFYVGLCAGLCGGFLAAYAAITWGIGK